MDLGHNTFIQAKKTPQIDIRQSLTTSSFRNLRCFSVIKLFLPITRWPYNVLQCLAITGILILRLHRTSQLVFLIAAESIVQFRLRYLSDDLSCVLDHGRWVDIPARSVLKESVRIQQIAFYLITKYLMLALTVPLRPLSQQSR